MNAGCVLPVRWGVCGSEDGVRASARFGGPICREHWNIHGLEDAWADYAERFVDGRIGRPMHNRHDYALRHLDADARQDFLEHALDHIHRREQRVCAYFPDDPIFDEDGDEVSAGSYHPAWGEGDTGEFAQLLLFEMFGIDRNAWYREKDAMLDVLRRAASATPETRECYGCGDTIAEDDVTWLGNTIDFEPAAVPVCPPCYEEQLTSQYESFDPRVPGFEPLEETP